MTKGVKAKDIRDFEKYVEKLNDLILRIREYCLEAQYYLANETLHILIGPSHAAPCIGMDKGEIVYSVIMKYTSC